MAVLFPEEEVVVSFVVVEVVEVVVLLGGDARAETSARAAAGAGRVSIHGIVGMRSMTRAGCETCDEEGEGDIHKRLVPN